MNIEDKTKEELISELKELQRENNLLKALKEKRADELVIANKELAFQNEGKKNKRKEAEYRLLENENYLKTIFDSVQAGIILIDAESHQIVDVNSAACNLFGADKYKIAGSICNQYLCPAEKGNCPVTDLGQKVDNSEKVLLNINGERIPIFKTVVDVTFNNRKFLLEFFIDITERKQAEESLKLSEDRFKTIFMEASWGIALIDSFTGHIFEVNPMFAQIAGRTVEQMGSIDWMTITHPDDIKEDLDNMALLNAGKISGFQMEKRYLKPDGTIVWIYMSIAPINHTDKNIRQHLCMIKDITERKQFEAELIKTKEHAEQSDRLKSAFLANMSHEIRTPMNGILGFAGLLKEPELSGEQQQEYIQIIEKSGARMLNIINDIVSISKIESGIIEIYLSETNINNQLQFVYDSLKLDADNKKLNLSLNCALPEKEAIITTDSEKFYGIISNLVKNAIKYTDTGTIEFGYVNKAEGFEFYVKDTGIGIQKERQEAIFERFIQADIEDKMARQGAGLGLSIAKAYVEMLGGKIWIESEVGKGSIFYFTLPYITEQAGKVSTVNITKFEKTGVNVENLKILIAEDDETSEMLISISVNEFSKEIIKAKTGNEAVEICRNNPDIDLILMDIQMLGLNGYEATKQIRKFNQKVVIIAQTAFGLTGDREKAINAGCNDYISKPIVKAELMSLIRQYFIK